MSVYNVMSMIHIKVGNTLRVTNFISKPRLIVATSSTRIIRTTDVLEIPDDINQNAAAALIAQTVTCTVEEACQKPAGTSVNITGKITFVSNKYFKLLNLKLNQTNNKMNRVQDET